MHVTTIVCPHCGNEMRVEIPEKETVQIDSLVMTPIGTGIVTHIREDDGFIEVKNNNSGYVTAFHPRRVTLI